MTIYGRHIRSYGPYTVIAKWTIYGAYRAIYGRHRTKPYMVTIYGNRHLPYMAQNSTIYGPPYTGRPYMVILARPYMVDIDHIWACRNRPYMVIQPYTVNHIWCTIYGHTVYGAPYIVPRRPYIVPRWAYMVHHIREGPYMVEHIRDIHIWSTIYGHNRSIYGHRGTIYCPAMGIYGPPYTGCPYMGEHIRGVHIWSTIYAHNISIYGRAYTVSPYMVNHIWSQSIHIWSIICGMSIYEWPYMVVRIPRPRLLVFFLSIYGRLYMVTHIWSTISGRRYR